MINTSNLKNKLNELIPEKQKIVLKKFNFEN